MDINGKKIGFFAGINLQKETIKKQCNGLFNNKFLEQLPNFNGEILRDNSKECFKPFLNGVCKITKNGHELIPFAELTSFVWKKQRVESKFNYGEDYSDCHFYRLIQNVSNGGNDPEKFEAFLSAMGYLLHNYNHPEKGQAIILYDEVITDPKAPMGGTGKGILATGLGKFSEMVKFDGKKFDENNRFCFQSVTDSTQIVFFDDVKTKLGFDRFNSILTDGWVIEKKNKDEFQISPEDSPKVLITSNTILDNEGTTRKRRQHISCCFEITKGEYYDIYWWYCWRYISSHDYYGISNGEII